MAVLNESRQVVFANRALTELAGAASAEEMCGLLPGEIVGCLNARGETACGDGDGCSLCGAAQAFQETLRTGSAAARECRWTVASPQGATALDLLARTTAFALDGERFVLLSLVDISAAKRRAALERIFFHDILNTVSSFSVYLDLLKASSMRASGPGRLVEQLEKIAGALVEEIRGQKVLVSAENRTLSVQRDLIETRELAGRLMQSSRARRRLGAGPSSSPASPRPSPS